MKKQVFSNQTQLPMFMIAHMDDKARKLFAQAHFNAKKKEEAEHVERAEIVASATE